MCEKKIFLVFGGLGTVGVLVFRFSFGGWFGFCFGAIKRTFNVAKSHFSCC